MKTKFINETDNITSELLEGYVTAYKDKVNWEPKTLSFVHNPNANRK